MQKFKKKPKKLKNVNSGKEIPCYESSPLVRPSKTARIGTVPSSSTKYISTVPSVIETFRTPNSKYAFKIKRSNGEIIYFSHNYGTLTEVKREISLIKNKTDLHKK